MLPIHTFGQKVIFWMKETLNALTGGSTASLNMAFLPPPTGATGLGQVGTCNYRDKDNNITYCAAELCFIQWVSLLFNILQRSDRIILGKKHFCFIVCAPTVIECVQCQHKVNWHKLGRKPSLNLCLCLPELKTTLIRRGIKTSTTSSGCPKLWSQLITTSMVRLIQRRCINSWRLCINNRGRTPWTFGHLHIFSMLKTFFDIFFTSRKTKVALEISPSPWGTHRPRLGANLTLHAQRTTETMVHRRNIGRGYPKMVAMFKEGELRPTVQVT